MTFTKEQISQAFIQVLNERVPDLSEMPDHVFSERFEKKMDKLIRREAAHPWAVSHTLAKNLIAAAIVIILLFALCMSVGAIRNAIFHFFQMHFEAHDDVVFEMQGKNQIDQAYEITDLPEGFLLKEETISNISIFKKYKNEKGDYILFIQDLLLSDSISFDNDRTKYDAVEIDGKGVFIASDPNSITLTWDQDEYIFLLILDWENVAIDDAISVFRSIRPTE